MLLKDVIERFEKEKGRKIGDYPKGANIINVTFKIEDWDTAEAAFQPLNADHLVNLWEQYCRENGFWVDSAIEIEELFASDFADINKSNLARLISDDDRIVQYATTKSPAFNTGIVLWNVIIPKENDPERIDLGSCLEDTLHRMIEAGMSRKEIFAETGMYYSNCPDEEDIPIDLGYHLSGSILQIVA